MTMSERGSGRTSRMLHRAVADALEGTRIMVVAANRAHAVAMYQRVAEMQYPQSASRSILSLKYGEGEIRFVVAQPNRDNERGWDGRTVVDHFVLETMQRS